MLQDIIELEEKNDTQAAENGSLMPVKTPLMNFKLITNLYITVAVLVFPYLSLPLIVLILFQVKKM